MRRFAGILMSFASPDAEPIVLRPSMRLARPVLLGLAGMLIVLEIVSLVSAGFRPAGMIPVALGLGPILVGFLLYVRNTSVTVAQDVVVITGMFGRRRVWPRSEVRGYAVRSMLLFGSPRPTEFLIFFGPDGHSIRSIRGLFWDTRSRDRLHVALGGSGYQVASLVDREALEREFPGALNWPDRHSLIFGLLVGGGGALVVIFGGVALLDWLKHR